MQNAFEKTTQKLKATEEKLEQQREKSHHLYRQVRDGGNVLHIAALPWRAILCTESPASLPATSFYASHPLSDLNTSEITFGPVQLGGQRQDYEAKLQDLQQAFVLIP